ncbi:MAG TPA: DUF2167 domain-containing protein [Verrucomicrobiae bacterium]|nr:DUF2167 domain-containing protein [Verrucomicrobiae bacterium]
MSFTKSIAVLALLIGTASLPAQTSENKSKVKFLTGPATARLSNVARVDVPAGYFFIDGKDYQAMLKAEREPVSGRELGLLSSTNRDWSVIFEYDDIGYVKDDDKDSLNADKLLDSIKRGTAEANKQRADAGRAPIEVIGWELPPRYDSNTHNLEWAIRGAVEGRPILNYNTRLLGRKGVMEVVLVVQPDQLNETLPAFRNLLSSYNFQTGETYAEYRPGDKIAKYGLGALVLGGAAVGAAKLGLLTWVIVLFKKAWKLVIVAFAAVASFFKKLFTGRSAKASQPSQNTPA